MPVPSKIQTCSKDSVKLARSFIDNWSHYMSIAPGVEREFLTLLNNLKHKHRECAKKDAEAAAYKTQIQVFESKVQGLEKNCSELTDRLINCQAELGKMINRKNALENELHEYKHTFEKARQYIKDGYLTNNCNFEGLRNVLTTSEHPSSRRSGGNTTTTETTSHCVIKYSRPKVKYTPLFGDDKENIGRSSDIDSNRSEDIDYDITVDSVDESSSESSDAFIRRSSRKRRSRSLVPTTRPSAIRFKGETIAEEDEPHSVSSKRSRQDNTTNEITATAVIKIDPAGIRKPSGHIAIRRSMNRSMSESQLAPIKPKALTPRLASPFDYRSGNQAKSWTRGAAIERRAHRVKALRTVWEACDVCHKRFGIAAKNALNCVDCHIRFHRQCHTKAPMPCIPRVSTPKTGGKRLRPSLKQFCPNSHPMIPPILIHCVLALEKDRLSFEGIYRIPGSEAQVTKMYDECMNLRVLPSFANIDTETITSVIKKFLRELRDCVIPSTSFEELIRAIENNNEEALVAAIIDFPGPNRDTLAFLMNHLQNVSRNSSHNKMPLENLACVLAPTLVGYSRLDTPARDATSECNRFQHMILLHMLKLPQDFWKRFLENNASATIAAEAHNLGSNAALLSARTATIGSHSPLSTPTKSHGSHASTCSPLIQPMEISRRAEYFKPLI